MAGPVMLIIRDGWGINPGGRETRNENGDATLLASTPFHDKLYADYPRSKLNASGADVGLPDGQMGNSEVGHLNLGAGRIVYQDLTRINKAVKEGELTRNRVLQEAFAAARGHRLHLLGLVSDGGVHSHYSHMIALANAAREAGVTEIFVHVFTDGRDTSPTGGAGFLKTCEKELEKSGAKIMTVVGRYFAMDRDRRWDRTKKAWDAIVLGRGEFCKSSPSAAVARQYELGKTDEFMPPLIFSQFNEQRVRDGDSVLFFNFRADRARQLSRAFLLKDFDGFDREVWPQVHFVTLTQYDVTYSSPFIFAPQELARMANYDLIILNFANPDMVGHTGIVEAGIKAVETVDECTARIISKLLELDGKALVTADHGNCEQMRNPDGSPNTAHTSNLVHLVYVARNAAKFRCEDGILADVAPTILFLLGLPQPKEMTGHNLLVPVVNEAALPL